MGVHTICTMVEKIIPDWSVLCMQCAGQPSVLQTLRTTLVLR